MSVAVLLVWSVLSECCALDYFDHIKSLLYPSRRLLSQTNLNETFFSSLENYQVNAVPVTEANYPWIARVIHSRTNDQPHVCTAVCIDQRIFITAARCIIGLKVSYTTVLYRSTRLPALAFVIPSNGTKQAFDDIGFVVVEKDHYKGMWAIIQLFQGANRTDNGFQWFAELDLTYGPIDYKVVGYATDKGIHRIKAAERIFNLTELKVIVDINLCTEVLTVNKRIQGFHVPCYHSCSLSELTKAADKCNNYHGVEGGAVFDTKTNKLVGVATWGAYFAKYELPVGFSVVNSPNFFKDYLCALRIKDDNGLLITKDYFQGICNDI